MYLKATADRLFGKDCLFSAIGAGRHQLPIITLSAILGGSVRVGLEDSLYSGPKTLATKSADQVSKIRSEEHTSELQSLMSISYAAIRLQKQKPIDRTHLYDKHNNTITTTHSTRCTNAHTTTP